LTENRLMEQVKRRSAALTLKSADALEALANFCQHRKANPDVALRFRFLTTAEIGKEQSWAGDSSGIATWESIRRGELTEHDRDSAIEAIGSFLQRMAPPGGVKEDAWKCLQSVVLDTSALADFIANFEWSVRAWDISQVEHRIKENLVESGSVSDAE